MAEIRKDLIILQLEQLMTVKKEFLHLQRIANFYAQNNKRAYSIIFTNISENIENSILKIAMIYEEDIEYIKNIEIPFEFLSLFSFVNSKIDVILKNLQQANIQITQEYEKYFDQFLPHPYMTRRYSNKAISDYVEKGLNDKLKEYKTGVSIYWGYESNYEMHSGDTEYDNKIETPFYYHELPYLIPNLFHELQHVKFKNNVNTEYAEIKNEIESLLKRISGKEISMRDDFTMRIPDIDSGFAEELLADLSAIKEIGISFLFSEFFSIISEDMFKVFMQVKDGIASVEVYDLYEEEKTERNKYFDKMFEINLRLRVVCKIVLDMDIDDDIRDYINKIVRFLKHIFSDVDNEKDDYTKNDSELVEYVKSKESKYYDGYHNINYVFHYVYWSINKVIAAHLQTPEKETSDIYLNLWKKKIASKETVLHRNLYREEILIPLFDNKELGFEPYELTYFKFNEYSKDCISAIDEYYDKYTGAKEGEYDIYESLGMYSYISIRKKNTEIKIEAVENFLKKKTSHIQDEHKPAYYTYKIAMARLLESNNGLGLGSHPDAIMQLYMTSSDINDIPKAFKSLVDSLEDARSTYTIYKILGPGDFIVIFNGCAIKELFRIKHKIVSSEDMYFRRVNITLMKKESLSNIILQDKKAIVLESSIRIISNIGDIGVTTIKDNLKKLGNSSLDCSTEVTDLRIRWNMNQISDIKEFLNSCSFYISDIRTKVYKNNDTL